MLNVNFVKLKADFFENFLIFKTSLQNLKIYEILKG
jgi:hypothetical protein